MQQDNKKHDATAHLNIHAGEKGHSSQASAEKEPNEKQEIHSPEEAKNPAGKRGIPDILSLALIGAMFLLGIVYYAKLPDKITAYAGSGDAGMASKLFGLFAVPFSGTLLYVVMTYIPPMLARRGKKIPVKTMGLLEPAALAYFLYTEISIIAFNASKISFSPEQDMAVALAIGIAYAAAYFSLSKTNFLPKLLKGASEESVALFNKNLGKTLAAWAVIMLFGFFAEKYLLAFVFLPAIFALFSAVYTAYKIRKSTEFSAIRKQVESPASGKNAP